MIPIAEMARSPSVLPEAMYLYEPSVQPNVDKRAREASIPRIMQLRSYVAQGKRPAVLVRQGC